MSERDQNSEIGNMSDFDEKVNLFIASLEQQHQQEKKEELDKIVDEIRHLRFKSEDDLIADAQRVLNYLEIRIPTKDFEDNVDGIKQIMQIIDTGLKKLYKEEAELRNDSGPGIIAHEVWRKLLELTKFHRNLILKKPDDNN